MQSRIVPVLAVAVLTLLLASCSGSEEEDCNDVAGSCDDGLACSMDTCLPSGECDYDISGCGAVDCTTDPSLCDDGDSCTTDVCNAGVCECTGGLTSCDTQCVDIDTDPNNCGDCGNACNTQCVAGECLE